MADWPPPNVPRGLVWVVQRTVEPSAPPEYVFAEPELVAQSLPVTEWRALCDQGDCWEAVLDGGEIIGVWGMAVLDQPTHAPEQQPEDRGAQVEAWIREGHHRQPPTPHKLTTRDDLIYVDSVTNAEEWVAEWACSGCSKTFGLVTEVGEDAALQRFNTHHAADGGS